MARDRSLEYEIAKSSVECPHCYKLVTRGYLRKHIIRRHSYVKFYIETEIQIKNDNIRFILKIHNYKNKDVPYKKFIAT